MIQRQASGDMAEGGEFGQVSDRALADEAVEEDGEAPRESGLVTKAP